MLLNMIGDRNRSSNAASWTVGEVTSLADFEKIESISSPDGKSIEIGNDFIPERPGLYQVKLTEQQNLLSVAANLAREECRTTAMSPDQLEQYGININKISSAADLEQAARQMRSVELEARQQWWRWLVLAGLVLIIVETALSAKGWKTVGNN